MELQNFYTETITQKLNSGDTKMYVSNKPTPTSGYLVVNPSNTASREIIKYSATGNDGSGDYVEIEARGVGGTIENVHEVGEPVRMNLTAEHWADLIDELNARFNKSDVDTDETLSANSDDKVASQKAVKTYIDNENAKDVHLTGDQTIDGVKTFTSSPKIPKSQNQDEPVTQQQLEDAGGLVALANETMAGKVMLANDDDIENEIDERDGKPVVVTPSKSPQPYWKDTKTYNINDMVWHDGKTWKSTIDNNINNNPSDGQYWEISYEYGVGSQIFDLDNSFDNTFTATEDGIAFGYVKGVDYDAYAYITLQSMGLPETDLAMSNDSYTNTVSFSVPLKAGDSIRLKSSDGYAKLFFRPLKN